MLAVEEPSLTNDDPALTFAERFADAFVDETRSFAHSVTTGAPFRGCTAREAVMVSRVADACARSSKLGEAISVHY